MSKQSENQNTKNLVIGVLVAIVLLLVLSLLGGESPSEQGQEDTSINDGTEMEETEAPSISFEGLSPDEWDLLERATNGIATLTSDQVIEPYIVADPAEENVVYFASTVYDEGDDEQMVGVYRYQTDTYQFERLFRRNYEEGQIDGLPDVTFPEFNVVGIDGDNLILLVKSQDDSPGPCANPLLLGETEGRMLWSMSIENPYDGFETYTLPTDVRTAAEAEVEACQN